MGDDSKRGPPATVCIDEIIEFAADLLAQRTRKHHIKIAIEEIYQEKISAASMEKILRFARALIRQRAEISKKEQIELTIGFLEKVIAGKDSAKDKLKASEQLSDLLGLSAKYKQDDGTAEERAREIRKFLDRT